MLVLYSDFATMATSSGVNSLEPRRLSTRLLSRFDMHFSLLYIWTIVQPKVFRRLDGGRFHFRTPIFSLSMVLVARWFRLRHFRKRPLFPFETQLLESASVRFIVAERSQQCGAGQGRRSTGPDGSAAGRSLARYATPVLRVFSCDSQH